MMLMIAMAVVVMTMNYADDMAVMVIVTVL